MSLYALKNYNFEEMADQIRQDMRPNRFKHTLGVEETAVKLAKLYGADIDKARVAALLHDVAKGLKLEDQQAWAVEAEMDILKDQFIFQSGALMHAFVGAYLAKKDYGIEDPEILSAIASHTIGNENMSVLDKIIFLADYIEPNRETPGVEEVRRLAFEDLDRGVLAAMNGTVAHLASIGAVIHPETVLARNALIVQMNEGDEKNYKKIEGKK